MAQATPFDPHRTDPAYEVAGEKRTIPANIGQYRVMIPNAAPFYRKGLVVKAGGATLTEGRDFYLGHQYMKGSHLTAQMMYGSIYIINSSLPNDFTLSYHKVGDDYSVTPSVALQYLLTHQVDPTTATWEDVIGERYMPPVDVAYDIDNWQGEAELITGLNALASTITSRPTSDDDFYQLAKDYVDSLAVIIEQGAWRSHLTDKANPHHTDYAEAGALKADGTAVNTNAVGGASIATLTAQVYAAGVTTTELAALFPLNTDRSVVGPLILRDGLTHFGYRRPDGSRRFAFHVKRANAEFSAAGSLNVVADAAANKDGTLAYLRSGNNVLKVISSGSSQDDTKLTYNDHQIYTESTIADAARGAINTDSRIYTTNSATLTWTGTGRSSDPLSANVVWPIASSTTAGIVKVSSRLDLNDSSVAASASAVKALVDRLSALIPTSRKVGGYDLTDDITLDKYDFGLGNVQNVSDVNMPVNANHTALLDNRSTIDHVHDLSDFTYTHATTSVAGVYRWSYATNSTATDYAVPAAVAISQYSAAITYNNRVIDKVPTNLLDMVQYGGGGYLPIPIVGSYQASGPNNAVMDMATFIHPDGTVVGLRNGSDVNDTGVFYMYGALKNNLLQNLVTTTTRYVPKGMPSTAFVSRAGRSSENALLFALNDGGTESLCFALLNGTMNGMQHQWCYADIDTSLFGGRDLCRAFPFIHQNYCYIASYRIWQSAGALTLSIFRASLDAVKAGGHVTFERMSLSGFDIHGDARSGTEFVVIAAAMTTVAGGKALIFNNSGAGSSNNIFHSNCCSSSFYNANGVLKSFFGSQGNQYIPAIQNYSNHSWDVDVQVNLSTGEVTNPTGLANTQITINPDGSRGGGLLGSGIEASGCGGWDWESGLDVCNGLMVSWRGHWASGWYLGQTTSNAGRSITDFFNAATRDHSRPGEQRVVNSFGSASHDYLHSIAFGEGNYLYGRNITDGVVWRAKVVLDADGAFNPSISGFGPTSDRAEITWSEFNRQKNHIPFVDGNGVSAAGGIIRTGALNAKVNQADTVQVSITQAQHDALVSAMSAAVGDAGQGDQSLTLFIPSDVSLPPVVVYQYTMMGTKYKSLFQYIAFLGVSSRTGAIANVTLGTLISHRKNLVTTIGSMAGPEGTDTGSGIMKTSEGKYIYVINAVNRAYYVGWMGCFGIVAAYDPASSTFTDVWGANHDNAFGPNGVLLVPRLGYVGLKTDNSTTAVMATTYGFSLADIKAGTVKYSNAILHSSQVTAGWKLYFTEAVNYFVGGTVYSIPSQSLDLQSLFPGAYQNTTFYIYANVSGGSGVYEVSSTKTADTATRTLVGVCNTGTDRILTLSADRVTNIFNLRNLVDHYNSNLAHGITEISKNGAGLGLVQNLGLYEDLSQLSGDAANNYASALLAMKAGYWGADATMLYGSGYEGMVVPIPAGFADNECLIFIQPWSANNESSQPITSYGFVFDRPSRTLTVARTWRTDGGYTKLYCAYIVIASKNLPAHIGTWSA